MTKCIPDSKTNSVVMCTVSLPPCTGDTLYYRFTSDMSNTEWGYKFTVTAGHLGRFQTGECCSDCNWKDFLELFCRSFDRLGFICFLLLLAFFFLNLLPSEFWKYVICLVQAATWLMALICCDCMLEIPNLYRGLEITIIITLLAFKASL